MLLNFIQALKSPVNEGTGQVKNENRMAKFEVRIKRLSWFKFSDAYRLSQSYFSLRDLISEACNRPNGSKMFGSGINEMV